MDVCEAERRDRVLRSYLEGRDWDPNVELRLVRELVANSRELLPELPYVVDYEWSAIGGRGDLVFADGLGRFAVVEVKAIYGAGSPTNRRTEVERQALKYAGYLLKELPEGSLVEALVYTEDVTYPGLRSAEGRRRPGRTIVGAHAT